MPLTTDDRVFLKEFFGALRETPLHPDDPRYINLYDNPQLVTDDPVALMASSIEWTPGESVQLLSGFKGTGKSTELLRLKQQLTKAGYVVVLCDAEDYFNLTTPIDVSDFLVALAGAFGEALVTDGLLADDPGKPDYWDRFTRFLQRRVELSELTVGLSPALFKAELKANLKGDPSFKELLQRRLVGHLGALVDDVHGFIRDCVKKVRDEHLADVEVVLILDSVDHIRGTSVNAEEVYASVETVFASHAEKLRLPSLHVVYTVPPYLKARHQNLGALYPPGGLHSVWAIKTRDRAEGLPWRPGLDACERVTRVRGDWERLLGDRAALDRLSSASGGQLRDLFHLLAEVLLRAEQLPVDERTLDAAINQVKSEFFPIADADALWLARIADTKEPSLPGVERLPDLARFLETHMVKCYRNGTEWYDVHPLIREEVLAQGTRLRAEATGAASPIGGGG